MRRALTGLAALAALVASCTDPHAPASFERLDCNACHGDRFDAVPVHADEGASRECYQCHGTTGWYPVVPAEDGRRRHSWFRIASGDHAGWDCWQCHIDGDLEDPYNDPTEGQFSCIGCHAHTEGRTAPHHVGMDEYEYAPTACRRCHRRGGGDD